MRIAVIGAGISGNTAAWALGQQHDVTLYEKADHFGGHANTVDVDLGGVITPVDTGFIVYNEQNYPRMVELFSILGVATEASDMSFGISLDGGALEYQSDNKFSSLFAQKRNLLSPKFWMLLKDMQAFYKAGPGLVDTYDLSSISLGILLAQMNVSDSLIRDHIVPMAACIWSASFHEILAFPASTFVRFFINHGLFSLGERPAWRTVRGGSRSYVKKLLDAFQGRRLLAQPVLSVMRLEHAVRVQTATGYDDFDHVVMACHGDEALTLIDAPTTAEQSVLGAFQYSKNHAYLHRDKRLMPHNRGVWSSWNYVAATNHAPCKAVPITYWMNLLQNLNPRHDIFVSLNPTREIDAKLIDRELLYEHPIFDAGTLAAQQRLGDIQGVDRLWYVGAYWRYGFHEDGCMSGLAVADALAALAHQPSLARVSA